MKPHDYEYTKNKKIYIDNYIFNSIVNHALIEYKRSIHENDVIKEIVYSNYKKTKINKFDILKNYLSNSNNRYINTYMINQAVLKINRELEEAKDEFEKLFREKEYSNSFDNKY